ncbi:YiiX/YebB-like N1pC/P60 family cysteine hydrolase [Kiritimatiellota bacterium B12222]|nr:YiiX/YebB-like N1pC/P60 family cysteine hydrolase [Kiritimatiellota bacterium B12222]
MTSLSSSQYALLEKARDTLLAAKLALPTIEKVEAVDQSLTESIARGYFTPDEEERIRKVFSDYLHVRMALHQTLFSLRPLLPRLGKKLAPHSQQAFVAAWLAGCILMRSARFMVSRYHSEPMLRKLLNRADPLYGIPEGSFDHIQRGSTRPSVLVRYMRAVHFAEQHQQELQKFTQDPLTAPLLKILAQEQPYIEKQKRVHATAYTQCQFFRIKSKPSRQYHAVMWGLFETSGRAIAEMRNPFHQKRVRRRIRKKVIDVMQPGDFLITRHDDAMSNLFLPGFWPHAAFIIGTPEQRQQLGVQMPEEQLERSQFPVCVLEAKKDGVRFRALRETLHVDAFVLFRPLYKDETQQRQSVERALSHEGKLYDFEFDFTRSDRLVCTEVVYRALDGKAGLHFDLIRKAGRFTLPAEELMKQGLKKKQVEIVLCYGLMGNKLCSGERSTNLVKRSLNL